MVRTCSVGLVSHAFLDVVFVPVSLCYNRNKSLSIVSTDITVATRMVFKPAYGQMLEFEPSAESFSDYVEQGNLFFTVNEVPEEKRVPVFQTIVGKSTYALLRNLLQPTLPKDKRFEDIMEILKKHYQLALSVIAERFQFQKRTQKEGESVAEYVAKLKQLSTHCRFEAYLNVALRDRLVCGLRKELTQK